MAKWPIYRVQEAPVEPVVAPAVLHAHPHAPSLLLALQSLMTMLAVTLFVVTFTVQPIRIPSPSMEPTLLVGDFLLMDKQSVAGSAGRLLPPVSIERGDVVVFHDPVEDPSVHLVKRVIGIPGDRIHLRDGVVFRNGIALREPYAIYRRSAADGYRDDFPNLHTMDARVNPDWWIHLRRLVHDGELTVPPGDYFVMGDNRNDSEDSRYWGFVPRDAIVGKPLLIYFSMRQPETGDISPLNADHAETRRPGFARWERTFQVIR